MWIWIAITVGVLFLLIIVLWLLGRYSPETYSAHIELFMKCSAEAIWAALRDIERHPVGAGKTRNITRLDDEGGNPVWEEDLGETRITVRTVESVTATLLKRTCRDHTMPMTAEIDISLQAVEGGTKINAVNRTTLRRGTWQVPIMRLVLRSTDVLERGLKEYFLKIGRTLDAEPRFHARPGQRTTNSGSASKS